MKYIEQSQVVESNIFNQLDEKKREIQKAGMDVINLSVGTPDFAPDRHVMEAVCEAASVAENYKYTLSDRPELIHAAARWYERRYGVKLPDGCICLLYTSPSPRDTR